MSDIRALGNGAFSVTVDGGSRLAYGVTRGAETWIFIDGRVFVVGSNAPARKRGDDQAALASPMPATVVAIKVAAGQRVAAGDLLVLLEAMKMELPISAPRDGEVREIRCREGELVQPGVPLVELS